MADLVCQWRRDCPVESTRDRDIHQSHLYDFDHTCQLSLAICISVLKLSSPLRTADPGLAVPAPFALAEADDSI